MSFFMAYDGKKIKYYSINEIADEFEKQRSAITRHLEHIEQEIGETLYHTHLYCGRDPKVNPKKPTLYISQYLYDLLLKYIQLEDEKREFYMTLTNNRKDLKSMITQTKFREQSSNLHEEHYKIPDLSDIQDSLEIVDNA